MKRHILYLTNYYLEDVIRQRNSSEFISQAGKNKSEYMIRLFEQGNNKVTVWSNAWTSNRSLHFYKGFQSNIDKRVFYSDIFGAPFFNVLFCKWSCKRFINRLFKQKKVDAIVFYNMRLENASVALWAKKKWGIPILLQYEDGLALDANVRGAKRKLYQVMEKKTLPEIDGAFLVNSNIKVNCPSVVVRGVIHEAGPVVENGKITRPDGMPILLFASTLDRQRGIHVLLEALQYMDSQFRLLITGRGECESLVCESQDPRVEYLGYLDYDAYKEVLQNADICINTQLAHARFASFSFPSKISEYLSERKIVVSSDVADAKEALDGIAILYENDDPKKLAEALEEAIDIWKNEETHEKYIKKIDRYLEKNSIEQIAKLTNRMLDEIIGET